MSGPGSPTRLHVPDHLVSVRLRERRARAHPCTSAAAARLATGRSAPRTAELHRHMDEHRAAGHDVPDDAHRAWATRSPPGGAPTIIGVDPGKTGALAAPTSAPVRCSSSTCRCSTPASSTAGPCGTGCSTRPTSTRSELRVEAEARRGVLVHVNGLRRRGDGADVFSIPVSWCRRTCGRRPSLGKDKGAAMEAGCGRPRRVVPPGKDDGCRGRHRVMAGGWCRRWR